MRVKASYGYDILLYDNFLQNNKTVIFLRSSENIFRCYTELDRAIKFKKKKIFLEKLSLPIVVYVHPGYYSLY